MRWLGGIPTNREQPEDIVQYVADLSNREDGVAIGPCARGNPLKGQPVENRVLTDCETARLPNSLDQSRLSGQTIYHR
jgi:hypothetical protein